MAAAPNKGVWLLLLPHNVQDARFACYNSMFKLRDWKIFVLEMRAPGPEDMHARKENQTVRRHKGSL